MKKHQDLEQRLLRVKCTDSRTADGYPVESYKTITLLEAFHTGRDKEIKAFLCKYFLHAVNIHNGGMLSIDKIIGAIDAIERLGYNIPMATKVDVEIK